MTNVVPISKPTALRDIPACVDCKWHKVGNRHFQDWHICKHPSAGRIDFDPVIGPVRYQGADAMEARSIDGSCGPEGKHFEEMHWVNRYFATVILSVIVLVVLFWTAWSRAEEPLPDSWAAQIELMEDPVFMPGAKMTDFEAEFGARMQPREGELEEGGELDPTGKPMDMEIDNLEERNKE